MVSIRDVQKILVIKLGGVGDVLLSTIVLNNLRRRFPDAQIDFLAEPPSRGILNGNPIITNGLFFDRQRDSSVASLWGLRKKKYDLVIDLYGNPRTALLTYFSRARYRVGFAFRGRRYAYNIVVPSRGGQVHNSEFNLDALSPLGIPIVDRSIPFYISRDDEEYVEGFLHQHKLQHDTLVVLNPGGTWYTKQWSLKKYAQLGDALTAAYKVKIVLIWGPGEIDHVKHVQEFMHQPSIIPPATTLNQLGALFRKCAFVVSNDAGPMHLAAVVGVPTLGIFGPTQPEKQGPVGERNAWVRLDGLECLGCNLTACPIGHLCMDRLSVDTVLQAVQRMLEKNKTTVPARIYA
jgi:ADP-heptose:LPS heptosyltransferase